MSFGALLVTGADGTQREIALDSTTALVGRSAANSIVLDEISIARRHARITVDSGRLFVEDLGSATGTFINEERVEPHVPSLVKPGDALRFGEVVAYFTDAIAAVEEPSSEGGAIVS
ncbi:MAG: FHA domain-containing protein, partial [Dehalococcoidia bacterium]|nr:FHA domain-containing protein [Dehalococcoidia bacterium]